jgi:maltose alpha-D-glucosyltransferase/alpha-amylase
MSVVRTKSPASSPATGSSRSLPYPPWLEHAVFYQIYPQSYCDSNGDGIGDLPGIISRLDYIASLGVDAIWLNPIFESPFRDAGYDITDFRKVAPRYGTNADAKRLFREAHKRGIRVIFDLVAGHTSLDHPWFTASRQHGANRYTEFYHWSRDMWQCPKEGNWIHGLGPRDGSYLANFFWSQPALNYGYAQPDPRYPWQKSASAAGPRAVRRELVSIMEYWLESGCDGFRVDMAPSLIKGPSDSKVLREFWQGIRRHLSDRFPEAVLISEWSNPSEAIRAGFHVDFMIPVGPAHYNHLFGCWSQIKGDHREPHAYFERAGGGDAQPFFDEFLKQYQATHGQGFISIPSGNHDFARLRHGRTLAEMHCIQAFLMTMPGVPFFYYGDEIGMDYLENLPPKEGSFFGRTGSRTPMQWTPGRNRGFSTAPAKSLYLPVDHRKNSPDVQSQEKDPSSLLHSFRRLVSLRRREPALANNAGFRLLHSGYPLVYERTSGRRMVLVVINPRREPATFNLTRPARQAVDLDRLDGTAELVTGKQSLTVKCPGLAFGIFLRKK